MIKKIVMAWICLFVALNVIGGRQNTIIWDASGMKHVKESLRNGEKKYKPALSKQVHLANKYMRRPLKSVMDKTTVPPSGDKHDFMSLSIYCWPNPSKSDGKPYIYKDGRANPECFTNKFDGKVGGILGSTPALALAYYYTDNEKYAKKAAEVLRVWFLDPATRMNPNLKYAEGVLGRRSGSYSGIITFSFRLHYLLDSVILISKSPHWTEKDDKGMKKWLKQYLHWLNTHPNAKKAKHVRNNHGTWFAAQLAYIQFYLGDKAAALETVKEAFKRLFGRQFSANGAQMHELKRTRPLAYSEMNLRGWMNMCKIAELAGCNMWGFKSKNGASVRSAIKFLAPVASKRGWKYKDIKKISKLRVLGILQRGYNVYGDECFLNAISQLPKKQVQESNIQLKFPLESKDLVLKK